MPLQIKVHPAMASILRLIHPNRFYRSILVIEAQNFEAYKAKGKAYAFVSSQIFRLTKFKWLITHGTRESRWYEPTKELLEYLSDSASTFKESPISVYKELHADEVKLESELSLLLAEVEEMKTLSVKYPALANYVDELVSNERSYITTLYGRLGAIKKLKVVARKL